MTILSDLLYTLRDGETVDVRVGLRWTAASVRTGGEVRIGLASTLSAECSGESAEEEVGAGRLLEVPARTLAGWAEEKVPLQRSIGMAALNALLPRHPERWGDENAEEVIARTGRGKTVTIVGCFPFVPRVRARVGKLFVLEKRPRPDTLPEEEAENCIPLSHVVAITSMTLLNGTLDQLLHLRRADATTILLGPTTPLSPLLFERGIDFLSGSIVEDGEAVLRAVSQGANFRQVHRAGVRLVTMRKEVG